MKLALKAKKWKRGNGKSELAILKASSGLIFLVWKPRQNFYLCQVEFLLSLKCFTATCWCSYHERLIVGILAFELLKKLP